MSREFVKNVPITRSLFHNNYYSAWNVKDYTTPKYVANDSIENGESVHPP